MKRIFTLAAVAATLTASAAERPLWLRDAAISPDGSTVAFTYKGDIYTVPATGGDARQLTSSPARDSHPVWSPDGRMIAFASDREGSADVYVADARGGRTRRITTHSGDETPLAFTDDARIIFSASIMPSQESANGGFLGQTFITDTLASRPTLYLSIPMRAAAAGPRGILYQDRKGFENAFRKHENSSSTADIWLYADSTFKRLTTFGGNDQAPAWGADGTFYYVSEEDGTLNVYESTVSDPATKRQLTRFTGHPVRSLSASADGSRLAFSWDGELYTLAPGAEPQRIDVRIAADDYDGDTVKGTRRSGATNMAVNADGDEVAFVLRGDVYVTNVKYGTTRRITDTPAQERGVSFAPDGRTLVYDSERDGLWQLFTATIKNDGEKKFAYATEILETPLYASDKPAQWPEYSPDGKQIAFWEGRTELRVLDTATKQARTALDGKYNYSYQDGDLTFQWSPDSRWLLCDYIGTGGWNNTDIALVKADGSQVVDLTESGYSDSNPRWALGGKAVAYQSGRYGMRSHGSWGEQDDILLMVLDDEANDVFGMSEEEYDLYEKARKEKEDADKDEADKKKSKKKDKKGKKDTAADKDDDPVAPLVLELSRRRDRMHRLTDTSARMGDYFVSPKGDKLYYVAANADGSYNLMVRDLREGDTKVLCKGLYGGIATDRKGENLFMLSGSGIKKVSLPGGDVKAVEFAAEFDRKPSLEREYIYDHMLRQVQDKFYDEGLHGVDWKAYGEHYRRFLPHINNNADFAELLSEILGELNASHTGGGYHGAGAAMSTASLGAFFDPAHTGEGLRVAELLGNSPLRATGAALQPGDIILAIDGHAIAPGADYFPLLEGKSGKKVLLTVRRTSGATDKVAVKPYSRSAENRALYRRWVARNEAAVDSLSGGRIAYVHVEGMDSPSFRTVYDRLLGKYRNHEAVIVDTRFNGGGWLHNDIALLLSGREYVRFTPRGQYIGSEPFSQWTKPSVMLVNEANYSDAHGTPFVYQTLGIGDIVGAPVPGTMTAVWWETQIDPTVYFGIPQVTSRDMQGNVLENRQLTPDVTIYNTPADIVSGTDAQLRGAVDHLLRKLDTAE
ncbi:MAG: PDZ domain-containing protein [Muribaculaceae bacterium]|nr:PDZ domain-containing protein [Muribaculaceae bacterium]